MSTKQEKMDEALADFLIHACRGEVAPFMAGSIQEIANLLKERTILKRIEAECSVYAQRETRGNETDANTEGEPPPGG